MDTCGGTEPASMMAGRSVASGFTEVTGHVAPSRDVGTDHSNNYTDTPSSKCTVFFDERIDDFFDSFLENSAKKK